MLHGVVDDNTRSWRINARSGINKQHLNETALERSGIDNALGRRRKRCVRHGAAWHGSKRKKVGGSVKRGGIKAKAAARMAASRGAAAYRHHRSVASNKQREAASVKRRK